MTKDKEVIVDFAKHKEQELIRLRFKHLIGYLLKEDREFRVGFCVDGNYTFIKQAYYEHFLGGIVAFHELNRDLELSLRVFDFVVLHALLNHLNEHFKALKKPDLLRMETNRFLKEYYNDLDKNTMEA